MLAKVEKTLSGVKYYDKVVLCLYGEEPRLDIYAHGDIWAFKS